MILVIDYNLKALKIWAFKEKQGSAAPVVFLKDIEELNCDEALEKFIRAIAGKDKLRGITFRIIFGGDYFNKPVIVDAKFFAHFVRLTDFLPFYIPSTLSMLRRFHNTFKGIPLIAYFETSFFSGLPDEKKYYALPFEYYKDSKIKKFGFHGIFHEASAAMVPSGSRIISIVFDKQTTLCAIHNKSPLSISLGYTPLEGVMSATACGDLDPGIAFYLMNVHNFSIFEIDEMLKNKSGFLGLTGYDIELKDMIKLRGQDVKVDLAFEVYTAQVMKHIGEAISILGGLDNIIISGSNVDILTPVIYNVIKKISFLGINLEPLPWDRSGRLTNITSDESRVRIYINRMSLSAILFRESQAILRNK